LTAVTYNEFKIRRIVRRCVLSVVGLLCVPALIVVPVQNAQASRLIAIFFAGFLHEARKHLRCPLGLLASQDSNTRIHRFGEFGGKFLSKMSQNVAVSGALDIKRKAQRRFGEVAFLGSVWTKHNRLLNSVR
jgi:hypothetical protein